jgi:glucose/arabinose dehydrogenase
MTQPGRPNASLAALLCSALSAIWVGGCSVTPSGPRRVNPGDVALPAGYRIEAVVTGLTFPTGIAFDDHGLAYVTEAGEAWGGKRGKGRLLRIEPDGKTTVVAEGDNVPWNGVDFAGGSFYVSHGPGASRSDAGAGGRIVRVGPDGAQTVVLDHLPSLGDHSPNGPRVGPDGWVYFAQGSATNSGVVGRDNFGWAGRQEQFHDIPARDVTLAGTNFTTGNTVTGGFLPFGTPSVPGQVIRGQTLCTGAVLRVRPDGGDAEVVAWGLRNPFGIAFAPDGGLYVTENSYDARGSRPVKGAADLLWQVEGTGRWHGWPDYHAGVPIDRRDRLLLADLPNEPPRPLSVLGAHAAPGGIDFAPHAGQFGFAGDAFVALFGDLPPAAGPAAAPAGFRVVRVSTGDGAVHDFAVNPSPGPASRLGRSGLERPVAVRFNPEGSALYVVDFGVVTAGRTGPAPRAGTGVLWRISRE